MSKKTQSKFIDNNTLIVVDPDGEQFKLNFVLPLPNNKLKVVENFVSKSFDTNYSPDKSTMIYFVLCDMQTHLQFSFHSWSSDCYQERKRIGSRLKEIREKKGMEARRVATLAKIDPANLSKIEAGKYSVGLDIISKIVSVLGARIEIIEECAN